MNHKPDSWPLASKDRIVRPLSFFLAVVVSALLYFVLFGFVLHKPQTIGRHHRLFQAKTDALRSIAEERKIVLIAGSNGRVSHSATIISEIVGLPAVNMSVTAGISIDYQLNRLKPFLREGDIIYMPLEYSQLRKNKKQVYSGVEAPYVIAYEKESLQHFSWPRKIHAALFFDFRFALSACAEMGLTAISYKRRITADDFNEWGDQFGHTVEKAKPYIEYINSVESNATDAVDENSYSAGKVSDFLNWCRDNSITVIGGYPTYAEGSPLPEDEDQELKTFYQKRGHYFLDLENKGRYPKSYFFDTVYHLAEPYQIEHSKLVGQHLKELIDREL